MHTILVSETVQPAVMYPLASAKTYLRVEHNFEDALIEQLLKAAVRQCERYARISFTEKVWDTSVDVPKLQQAGGSELGHVSLMDPDEITEGFWLPKRLAKEVVSATAFEPNEGTTLLLPADTYTLRMGRLYFKQTGWDAMRPYTQVTVRYKSGYLTLPEVETHLPDLLSAIGICLREAYHRGEGMSIPLSAQHVLNQIWSSPSYAS